MTEERLYDKLVFNILRELPLSSIIKFLESHFVAKVILQPGEEPALHCPGCSGRVDADDQGIDDMPCPGVQL